MVNPSQFSERKSAGRNGEQDLKGSNVGYN
jgi:hypothetical protein